LLSPPPAPLHSAPWSLCRCEPTSYFSHSDTTNTSPGGFCHLPPTLHSSPWTLCRCEPLSYFSHSDTANTAPGGFCFRRLSPLFILRCDRCAAVSQFLIFLTATQRTQRLKTFTFAAPRPLSILRCGRCAAVSQFLIFLTATQRTQRLKTFTFAAPRPSSFFAVVAVPL